VVVAHVPWAKHDAGHTHAFDAQVAWLAVNGSKQAVTRMMRVAWRTVGAIVTRYRAAAQAAAGGDGLDSLTRIGIDEISYKRGHKYLTVVVDHDTADLVWAAEGREGVSDFLCKGPVHLKGPRWTSWETTRGTSRGARTSLRN
jgi:transposase